MARPAVTLAKAFRGNLRSLDRTRERVDALLIDGHLVKRDAERLYEGIFLASVGTFEAFLEQLFLGLLVGRVFAGVSSVRPKVIMSSPRVARDLVFGGRPYVDWLPYEQTEKRARIFFAGGRPFTTLDDNAKKILEECRLIRNAIAHKSRHALLMYEKNVLSGINLPPRERRPAGYLRSQFRIAPPQCRYENLAAQMFRIAGKLCL